MTNQYELVFIMTPVLSDEQLEQIIKKYKKILTDGGAEIVFEDNWGLRKMAYPIQKKSTGFYYLIEFKGQGKLISQLETSFNRDERILRYLTVKLDKFAIAYNKKKREKAKEEKKMPESSPESKKTGDLPKGEPPPVDWHDTPETDTGKDADKEKQKSPTENIKT